MVSVLFVREKSVYKNLCCVDCWDVNRDARLFCGPGPVVAHPPCRAWGRLRRLSKPRPDEKELALFAVDAVRQFGGVLEHPAYSSLWDVSDLPRPGRGFDSFGGWSLSVNQSHWGHRAEKETWLYIVGCKRKDIPLLPLSFSLIQSKVENLSKSQRESTPIEFAWWLLDLAARCRKER